MHVLAVLGLSIVENLVIVHLLSMVNRSVNICQDDKFLKMDIHHSRSIVGFISLRNSISNGGYNDEH